MRQIILDTETTGIDPKAGHRLIELGCIELVNRRFTGNNLHFYINPKREIEQEAIEVHGITNEFLKDKPVFSDLIDEIMDYLAGAELVIHNAAFDVGFLNHELNLLAHNRWQCIEAHCGVLDTLALARKLHPGQRNSLDALCKRYDINYSHRQLHGALLDAQLLGNVYLAMTGGQTLLTFDESPVVNHQVSSSETEQATIRPAGLDLVVIKATGAEVSEHQSYLSKINEALWSKE